MEEKYKHTATLIFPCLGFDFQILILPSMQSFCMPGSMARLHMCLNASRAESRKGNKEISLDLSAVQVAERRCAFACICFPIYIKMQLVLQHFV